MLRRAQMLLLGILIGVGVGVIAALLFTPASGARMRREAQEYYAKLLAEARQAAEARRQELEKQLSEMTGGTAAS